MLGRWGTIPHGVTACCHTGRVPRTVVPQPRQTQPRQTQPRQTQPRQTQPGQTQPGQTQSPRTGLPRRELPRRADELTRLIGRGLVEVVADAAGDDLDDLVVLLQLSRWLRQAGFEVTDRDDLRAACACLVELRARLLAVAGLDPAAEPVPLVAFDPRVALPSLVLYLGGLLVRGARQRGVAPAQLAEQACGSSYG